VTRRGPAPVKLVVATCAILFAVREMSARADGIVSGTADYTLSSTTTLTSPSGPPPDTPNTSLSGTVTSGSTTVSVPSTTNLAVGYGVSGSGIPSGTTITQINADLSQVTLSQSATASGSESLVFSPQLAAPQVVALIEPAGGVVTPASSATQGPLTILSASPDISTSGVYDYLASTTSNGQSLQALGLSFYGNGLTKGDYLKFSLNVANQSNPPQLVSQTSGITITYDPPTSVSSNPPPNAVPEPLSMILWSVLGGAGLVRLRRSR
jgi:hypothetical protein